MNHARYTKRHPLRRPQAEHAEQVTQSIRILLNTLLQPERLQKEWDYFLKHKDPQIPLRSIQACAVLHVRPPVTFATRAGRRAATADAFSWKLREHLLA